MDAMIFFCCLYLCSKAYDCWQELQRIRIAVEEMAFDEGDDDG